MFKRIKRFLFIIPKYAIAGSASGGGIAQVASVATLLQDTITGPIGMTCSIVAIVGAGIAWAMADHGTGARKFSAVAMGVVIVVNAVGWFTTIFGANV
ncbi:MAG: TrbC/VirB2 family protein [Burkholderiales bacterium]|nr:TrbC/VirB2 family protein [Burkholderiales bacterium]